MYKRGKVDYPFGERRTERLYVEGDGIWLSLQRDRERHMEIKVGIAYEGCEVG